MLWWFFHVLLFAYKFLSVDDEKNGLLSRDSFEVNGSWLSSYIEPDRMLPVDEHFHLKRPPDSRGSAKGVRFILRGISKYIPVHSPQE